jgi:hypothetical protein
VKGTLLHKSYTGRSSPLPRTDLAYGLSNRHAKGRIAIEHGDTDLDLGDLPVEVPCHERLAHQFEAVHLGFDAASSVVSAPASPHSAAQISLGADRVVPSDSSSARRFPGFGIFAWWDHRVSVSGSNGFVAFTRVVRSVCRDTADVLARRNLVQEIWQHGCITDVAACDFDSPYL